MLAMARAAPQPREILVRGPSWTGDVVMATPGFRALRSGFPGARLILHVRAVLLPLLAGAPWFDETLPVESYGQGTAALLAPGASYGPSKLWPSECFARVGDLLGEAGASVVLAGTQAERGLSTRVLSAMRRPAVDLTGELDLGALKALVRRARVLVCNDAGARHIAVALGTPCVVVMGPTSLEKTSLNLERVKVVSADVDCRPCYLRECPIDHRCMTHVSAERVARAALTALAPGAEGRFRGEVVRLPGEARHSKSAGSAGEIPGRRPEMAS